MARRFLSGYWVGVRTVLTSYGKGFPKRKDSKSFLQFDHCLWVVRDCAGLRKLRPLVSNDFGVNVSNGVVVFIDINIPKSWER